MALPEGRSVARADGARGHGRRALGCRGRHRSGARARLPAGSRGPRGRGDILPELQDEGTTASAADRFALFEATAAWLRDVAADEPLFLVIDDVHALDPSSVSMLRFVAHELRTARAVVVATHREHVLGASDEVLDALARLGREGTWIRLARLGREDVGRLVAASGGPVPAPIVDLIFNTSEGVPLFVEEIVRTLGSRDGAWRTGAPIPAGVRAAIRDWLVRLDQQTRRELELASVVGATFTLALVGVVSDSTAEQLHAHVERAVDAAVLERLAPGRYAFTHGLLREALYRDIAGGRRAGLHATIFGALSQGRVEAPIATHAHHAPRAAPVIRGPAPPRPPRARRGSDTAPA